MGGGKEIYFCLAIKEGGADQRDCHLSVTSCYKNLHHCQGRQILTEFFFTQKVKIKALCLDLVHQLLSVFQMPHIHISV